ncbi:MAG: endonuclease YncB(thermonuclease family) [Lysobacterales bacterium]|jgi:endonuclease YncB( thermonuclease family)
MTKRNALTQNILLADYNDLLKSIHSEMLQSKEEIELRKVRAYWVVGDVINTHLLKNKTRADYNTQLYNNLSRDTGIHAKTLQKLTKFAREFEIPNARSQFNWTAYRTLLKVDDQAMRLQIMNKIRREGIKTRAIAQEVLAVNLQEKGEKANSKIATKLRGTSKTLFTYKLINPAVRTPTKNLRIIDCGFTIWREVPCVPSLNTAPSDTLVRAVKRKDAFKLKGSLKNLTRRDLFTYQALNERVVDGDTVIFQIDLGFRTWTRQYLRLRGINAPERGTPEGKRAQTFLHRLLNKNPTVTIKTYQADIYGRYITDIFLSDGIYVNQLLIDKGYAQRY